MTSLAFPERRVLSVDLYPRVTASYRSGAWSEYDQDWMSRTLAGFHHKRQARVDAVGRFLGLLRCHRYAITLSVVLKVIFGLRSGLWLQLDVRFPEKQFVRFRNHSDAKTSVHFEDCRGATWETACIDVRPFTIR